MCTFTRGLIENPFVPYSPGRMNSRLQRREVRLRGLYPFAQGFFDISIRMLLIVAFSLLLPASCVAQGEDPEQKVREQKAYFIPIVQLQNKSHAHVRVTLDKGEAVLLMVDTGSPNCLLDREVARKLKLPIKKGKDIDNRDVEYVNSSIKLESADLSLDGAAFVLVDLSEMRRGYPEFAGILGKDALQNFAVFFDFSKPQITLYLPGKLPVPKKEGDGIHRIPLLKNQFHYYVEGKVDDKPVRLVVDTGAEVTTLRAPELLTQLKPVASLEGGKSAVMSPKGDKLQVIPTRDVRLRQLSIGTADWKDPIVTQPLGQVVDPVSVLGLDFLHRYDVMVDFPGRMLYLLANPKYKEDPGRYIGTGLRYGVTPGKPLRIDEVRKPSPAQEAGLMAGDEIVEINGEGITPDIISWAFIKKISALEVILGTEMTYKVKRKGEKQPLSFTLKTRKLL
jgi:predicted aspartyl protease